MNCESELDQYLSSLKKAYRAKYDLVNCEANTAYGIGRSKDCVAIRNNMVNAENKVMLREIDLRYCYKNALYRLSNRIEALEQSKK